MKKCVATDARSMGVRKHLEVFRQENAQYERLLKLLNTSGTVADRLRQALDEVDRACSVTFEIQKAREAIEAEIERLGKPGDDTQGTRTPARYETSVAAFQASNAKLLEAVQQQARENQLLVCRALAMVQRVINTVSPKPVNESSSSHGGTEVIAAA